MNFFTTIHSTQHPQQYALFLHGNIRILVFNYVHYDEIDSGVMETFLNIASTTTPLLRILIINLRSIRATSLPAHFLSVLHRWPELQAVAFDADLEGDEDVFFLRELDARCQELNRTLTVVLNRSRVIDDDVVIAIHAWQQRMNNLNIFLLDDSATIANYLL
ncbi:hypothetical protein HA402_005435 [Bradysia odoriphaga]|nr:hypothetical protein HA402_005435 [Bradysia odoriphaga]